MPNKKRQIPTNSKADSKVEVPLRAITFAELWAAYPAGTPYVDPKTGDVPPGFENQCAIRMSVTLHKVGVEMQSFRGKGQIRLDGKRTAVLASELADWLRLKPLAGIGAPEDITGADWQKRIKGRTGIVAFKNYWRRDGESAARVSGGHVDLWNGLRMTISSAGGLASNVGRFVFGINSNFLYSDLGKSTEILFWEIK
ncbi:type VI secretion system amidase effector protein Tae4 [Cupriavidus consociatus]|uniref:type VI secretion system amidase effector protein Tae4 n=1 Tax=Cupriavidus consociatus TaxID=2821357 RepID=UPI001AEA8538|nr:MULTISPECIES: type VI secretion system amidase effector protein Tae4 [unclassified Cupriavidus]MBP0622002.1 hypothetical protein [Cupriavidus sp. LEh25]MDK2658678.1 type VI secretion system amidase effector protein Tae4 [Cupriavidus sp. LEh21]